MRKSTRDDIRRHASRGLVALLTWAALAPSSHSQTSSLKAEPLPYPAAVVMPWRPLGIDALELAASRVALEAGLTSLKAAIISSPMPVTTLLKTRPPTWNRQKLTDVMAAGAPKGTAPSLAFATEPVWCSLMDRHVFAVTLSDTRLGTLLGAAHVTVTRARWMALGQGQGAFLTARLPELAKAALAKAAAKPTDQADALHIGLSLAKHATRRDEGSSHCLNLLLEERLAPDFTVVRALGTDHLATLRDALGQPAALRRPTRGLVLNWRAPETADSKTPPRRGLPATFTLEARLAETVFGKHVPVTHQSLWTVAIDGQERVQVTIDPAFLKLLTDERRSLVLADLPQVAKIDRAWVYLDRGRAWGLKMNDRLVADAGGDTVKGHVVRFFGPEEGLASPRGFPIREGAIVYVRKNQAATTLGLTFRFDPRQYPTPFPLPDGG